MDTKKLTDEILEELKNLLSVYYPKVIDNDNGGYFSNFSYNWEKMPEQEKMIVSQSRHIWACSKASDFFKDLQYKNYSEHGYDFLRNKMWDKQNGGFFQIRSCEGTVTEVEGWFNEKRVYGNAFAIYGLSALYQVTKNPKYLDFAVETFNWIEDNAYDNEFGGYYQFFTEDNQIFDKNSTYKSRTIPDAIEIGYKDQNSSIHILEAYTELYHNWADPKLKKQLTNMLELIRDKLVHPKGYLQLFFNRDFTPISFKNCSKEEIAKNFQIDHVSFGHDYETSFLLLEASYILGIENDTKTLEVAKKMADHAISNGWDSENGGFFDEGYYYDDNECTIVKDSKNWWAQAEALNIYLMLYLIFDDEIYYNIFIKEWEHIKNFVIDKEHGDWFWGSIEKEPEHKTTSKATIWKTTYHNSRALMNCYIMLSNYCDYTPFENENINKSKEENKYFIEHWKSVVK